MKVIPLAALLFLLVPSVAATCETYPGSDFLAWAELSSRECDLAWTSFVTGADGTSAGASASAVYYATSNTSFHRESILRKSRLDFCSPSGIAHKLVHNQKLFPMSTRRRGDARHGNFSTSHITKSHLNVRFERLRPLNSRVQQSKPIRSMGSPTRPRIDGWGRLNRSNQRKSAVHPGSIPSRPRLF